MKQIDPKKWEIGTKIEIQFVEDKEIAREIARRKLVSDPNAYPSSLDDYRSSSSNSNTGFYTPASLNKKNTIPAPTSVSLSGSYYLPSSPNNINNGVNATSNTKKYNDIISKEMVKKILLFFKYMVKKLNLENPPKLKINTSDSEWNKLVGSTGHYNPDTKTITIFIYKRNLSDICRTLSHELIHYWQDNNGKLNELPRESDYAQKSNHLRNIEKEAYLLGNILFRDFRDNLKTKNLNL